MGLGASERNVGGRSLPAYERGTMARKNRVTSATGTSGKVEISRGAIAAIAQDALTEAYGVVGMAPSGLRGNLAYYLRQADPQRGIEVEVKNEQITINLSVILEYGVRISEVAENIKELVKFAVERALAMNVVAVNVYVQGLHFSDEMVPDSTAGS